MLGEKTNEKIKMGKKIAVFMETRVLISRVVAQRNEQLWS